MSKKVAGIVDVAKASGVSIATVSRVLNGSQYNVNDAMRARVMEAVKGLDYAPNLIGRQLKTRSGGDIAIVVQSLSNPFYSEIVRGVESKLKEYPECNLLIYNSYGRSENELHFLKTLHQRNIRGLLLSTCTISEKASSVKKCVDSLCVSGVKVVMYDQNLEGFLGNSVLFDMQLAGKLAVDHLIALGHKQIAIVNAPLTRHSRITLFEAFKNALANHGLVLPEEYCVEPLSEEDYQEGNYAFDNGKFQAEKLLLLPQPPTAIFATNDLTAYGIIQTLYEHKRKVGKDISVVGFNDLLYSSMIWPPLTTIRQPLFQMGTEAFRLLSSEMKDANAVTGKVYLSVHMIERGSSAPCNRA